MTLGLFNFGKAEEKKSGLTVLELQDIKVALPSVDKYEAIRMAGEMLLAKGCVAPEYIEAMVERENVTTTYIGDGVAIPHGVGTSKQYIKKTGLVVLQFQDGVDFDGEKAYIIVGIAGQDGEHLPILTALAKVIMKKEKFAPLKSTHDPSVIYRTFVQQEQ